jgi:hypothetical protein
MFGITSFCCFVDLENSHNKNVSITTYTYNELFEFLQI